MILKRIDPSSCAKVYGVVCVAVGLIAGLFISVAAWLTSSMFDGGGGGGGMGMLFRAGAIIFLPIFYGVIGFIMGYLSAVVYNVAAKSIGGIEVEFE